MQLSAQQESALDKFFEWYASRDDLGIGENGRAWFTIHGPAGVGKTFLASEISDRFKHDYAGRIYPMAYAGKAASVMRKKGMINASTIHSKIYLPASEADEEADELQKQLDSGKLEGVELRRVIRRLEELRSPTWALRSPSPFKYQIINGYLDELLGAALVILDECSQANIQIRQDLLSFKVPVLVLGDPFQLPPVEGGGAFDSDPDVVLTEVHRQALESPVLQLATMAREGKLPAPGKYGESLVTTRNRINKELALSVEQIICGTNKSRRELNAEMRAFLGFSGDFPQKGERIICLRNNRKEGLLNGEIFPVFEDTRNKPVEDDVEDDDDEIDENDDDEIIEVKETKEKRGFVWIKINADGVPVKVHRECFDGRHEYLKAWDHARRSWANEFDFAYAITCHKAQGSEWESVLAFADMFRWSKAKNDFHRWLYTACTRASERVILAL